MNSLHNVDTPGESHGPGPRRQRRVKGRAKGEKLEERGRKTTGRIVRMLYGQSYGLIRMSDRRDVFFHRKDARASLFNNLSVGDHVAFELIEDPLTGPRGVRVSRAA
jgi:cold shock CspA family protein